jgi:hypothetical protein
VDVRAVARPPDAARRDAHAVGQSAVCCDGAVRVTTTNCARRAPRDAHETCPDSCAHGCATFGEQAGHRAARTTRPSMHRTGRAAATGRVRPHHWQTSRRPPGRAQNCSQRGVNRVRVTMFSTSLESTRTHGCGPALKEPGRFHAVLPCRSQRDRNVRR